MFKSRMHTTNLRKVGAKVGMAVESGRLVVAPQKWPSINWDKLLAQCDLTRERTMHDRRWLGGKPAGRELL